MQRRFVLILSAIALLLSFNAPRAGAQTDAPKLEVSAVFTAIRQNDDFYQLVSGFEPRIRHNFGGGGRFTYNLTNSIALEGEVTFHPKERGVFFGGLFPPFNSGTQIGGRRVEGLFGVKAGKRWDKFGIFAKARPGFMRFTNVPNCPGGNVEDCREGGKTEFALDLGGVVEYYPTRRFVLRFDAGDTIIRYGKLSRAVTAAFPVDAIFPAKVGGGVTHNAQYSVGFGVRF